MKVTREVMNDLLPAYFSGEASADTKALMEEYFRENPEFERVARGSARSLEALQETVTVAPEAKKEKRDLEKVHKAMWRRKMFFGLALFFTLAPLAFTYSKGHIAWMMVRNEPWSAAFYWFAAALFWVLYFMRLPRRSALLVIAIFFAVMPLVLLHDAKTRADLLRVAALFWSITTLFLIQFFAHLRRRTTALMLAIFTTGFPIPFVLHAALNGGRKIVGGADAILWAAAVILWFQYFRLRRKTNVDEDECG